MKESFVFYRSFYESFKDLPDESRLKLYDNLCEMALNGNDVNGLTGIEKSIFTLIKPQIEANYKRYLNGLKGNKSKQRKSLGKHDVNAMGKHDSNANVNVNENDNDNVNENVNEDIKRKPTLEEVINYVQERNSNVDPQTFYDYYNVANWKDVKNWKQKLITWEKHQTNNNKKTDKEKLDEIAKKLAYLDEE